MSKTTCSIEGCEHPHVARGWCGMHWQRWAKHGTPHWSREMGNTSVEERLFQKVVKTDACWVWTASLTEGGYGRIATTTSGSLKLAHVLSWELVNGPVPDGKVLHHRCETPACVNPEHLEPLTRAEHRRLHAAARTHCRRGHPLGRDWFPGIRCKTCKNADERRRYHAKKEDR